MALIRLDHVPETVQVNLPLYIILPDPGPMGSLPVRKRKVLYLLHGLSDDASAWRSRAQQHAGGALRDRERVGPGIARQQALRERNLGRPDQQRRVHRDSMKPQMSRISSS